MKKEDLKVGDKIVLTDDNGIPIEYARKITDLDSEYKIIGLGYWGCNWDNVGNNHKFVREDGSLEDIE